MTYENYIRILWAESKNATIDPDKPVRIIVKCYFSIPKSYSKAKKKECVLNHIRPTKKPDADNILKIVCDALNGVAYHDDKQIVEAKVCKFWGTDEKEYLTIEIEEM